MMTSACVNCFGSCWRLWGTCRDIRIGGRVPTGQHSIFCLPDLGPYMPHMTGLELAENCVVMAQSSLFC